tara:strand:+ start:520 stop:876 length:357 start_codon:yes stop_codon:yes gene_type:complete
MKASLFDNLYHNIDISAGAKAEAPEDPLITPAQRTPETQEIAQQKLPKNVSGMKFTHSLIKHLDMLYSKILAGEVAEIASEPSNNRKQKMIVGQTDALVLEEKEAFFNPGNSSVTESM